MRAVILAGGKGRRLRPYTTVIPKPLMPIGEMSILDVVIRQLKSAKFERITIAVGYLGQLIEAYLGDGKNFGIKIDYVYEEKPLNTIGPLAFLSDINETFLVMNGDILTDIKYNDLIGYHIAKKSKATIACYKREQKIDFGVLDYDETRKITSFVEKPRFGYDVSMGIYIFEPSVLQYITKGEPYGFDQLVIDMIKNKEEVYSYIFDGNWLDIGRPDDYENAIDLFESKKNLFLGSEE